MNFICFERLDCPIFVWRVVVEPLYLLGLKSVHLYLRFPNLLFGCIRYQTHCLHRLIQYFLFSVFSLIFAVSSKVIKFQWQSVADCVDSEKDLLYVYDLLHFINATS